MQLLATVNWLHYMFMVPLAILSVFLILVILVQRGRGGGLTGALGGMGGQSAFGTKAGDLFTRITIVVAAIWVILSMASIKVLSHYSTTATLNPSERGQPTPPAKMTPGTPPALPTGDADAGKKADSQTPPASTPPATEGAAEQPPASNAPATTPPANAPPISPPPASPPSDAEAKPSDAAKP